MGPAVPIQRPLPRSHGTGPQVLRAEVHGSCTSSLILKPCSLLAARPPALAPAAAHAMAAPADDTAALLRAATRGFDHIFSNEILAARAVFDSTNDSAFHALGLGVCAFLEAALGMEVRPRPLPSSLRPLTAPPGQPRRRGEQAARPRRGRREEAGKGYKGCPERRALPPGNRVRAHPRRHHHPPRLDERNQVRALPVPRPPQPDAPLTACRMDRSESYMGYLQCL